jgi:hypothetical protein
MLGVPQGPGLGCDLTADAIAPYVVWSRVIEM